MNKQDIRNIVKEKIKSIGQAKRDIKSDKIFARLIKNENYVKANNIFVYISFSTEVKTEKIIEYSLKLGKNIFVPYIVNDKMKIVQIDENTKYSKNIFGIKEPIIDNSSFYDGEIDLILLPLISFDRNKTRLGRGGGFYDKFLESCSARKIAIAYAEQEFENLIKEKHDIQMSEIITDKEIIK